MIWECDEVRPDKNAKAAVSDRLKWKVLSPPRVPQTDNIPSQRRSHSDLRISTVSFYEPVEHMNFHFFFHVLLAPLSSALRSSLNESHAAPHGSNKKYANILG